jgi:uncharacterized membrane protein YkoI
MWRVPKPAIVAALAAALCAHAAQAAEPGCVEWSQAGPIITGNGLVPANVVFQNVQRRVGGKIVSQALCNSGGQFVYRLVVLGPTGEVTNVTVDARTGQF